MLLLRSHLQQREARDLQVTFLFGLARCNHGSVVTSMASLERTGDFFMTNSDPSSVSGLMDSVPGLQLPSGNFS